MRKCTATFLLAVGLAAGTAAQAEQLTCRAATGSLPPVRTAGVSERMADIYIGCTGGTPTASGLPIPRYDVSVSLDTAVTSRTLASGGSEALLLLEEPLQAQQLVAALPNTDTPLATGLGRYDGGTAGRPTVFVGMQTSESTITFRNIPIDPPGPGAVGRLRIVNLRANATAIGDIWPGFIPNVISATVAIAGTPEIAAPSPTMAVAAVALGLDMAVTAASISQCAAGTGELKLRLIEAFGTALRPRHIPGGEPQNVPGVVYNTESGFTSPAFAGTPAEGAGQATQATRVFVRFLGVPAHVAIKVPATIATTPNAYAPESRLVLVAPATDGSTADADGNVALSGGTGMAVWEFDGPTISSVVRDQFPFTVSITTSGNPQSGAGTISVQSGFAPETLGASASASAPLPRFVVDPNKTAAFTILPCLPTIRADRTTLNFAAVQGGSPATPAQSVAIYPGEWPYWTATSDQAWLSVSPASGTGNARLTFSLVAGALPPPGRYTATVTVSGGVTASIPTLIVCSLTVKPANAAPFGAFETPADGTVGVAGAIPVTGWALDDIAMDRVMIYRDRLAGEPAGGSLYVGDAIFVPGARPDVERAYADAPLADRAGWGYMLLTNTLPNQGNGELKLYAIATDKSGQQTMLGTKTIQVDNAHSQKPFGSIATPAPGATVRGPQYVNFGWALTPQPASIASGGHLYVFVDGLFMGALDGGDPRSDISALFPGYADTPNAVRHWYMDTQRLTDGMHSIAWSAWDSRPMVQGIGSRYFYVGNGVLAAAQTPAPRSYSEVAPLLERGHKAGLRLRRGFDPEAPLEAAREPGERVDAGVSIEETGRLEFHLPAGEGWTGYHRFGEELRPLPVGSHLDEKTGVFTWLLGPGFVGEHELVFVATGQALSVPVKIVPMEWPSKAAAQ